MATTKLYLKNKHAQKSSVILLYLLDGQRTIKISTKEKIDPRYWDADRQQAKRQYTGAPELNEYLNSFSLTIVKTYRQLKNEGIEISLENIKDKLYPKQHETRSIWYYYDEFCRLKSDECSENTVKKYRSLKGHLEEYSRVENRLDFSSFDISFYDKFSNYLLHKVGLTNNTVGKYFQGLKTFLGWCHDRELIKTSEFKKYKVRSELTDIVYLTEDELKDIINLDLSTCTRLDKVRDLFLFACYTGQRFSDVQAIRHEDIIDDVWHLKVQKTRDSLNIPLIRFSKSILKKYEGGRTPLPRMSNPPMNRNLKELGERAMIAQPIKIVKYQGNKRIEEIKLKYELITTHTARRTFVTLSLEKGMRPETLMEITGHKDYRVFKRYIKITSQVKQNEMNKIWG